MPTYRKKAAAPALLTNALVTFYTVPNNTLVKDITLDFLNTDTTNAIGVTLHLVPSGGTASDTNKLFSETSPGGLILSPQEWRSIPLDQAISAGDFIQIKASTTGKVACHVTITEVS